MRIVPGRITSFLIVTSVVLAAVSGCGSCAAGSTSEPSVREVTLLYTNDFESAYDPIPVFWRDDLEQDPGERHDLSTANPKFSGAMRDRLVSQLTRLQGDAASEWRESWLRRW